MNSNSTSPTRIGRLHAIPKKNIYDSRYAGDELSQSKGPVLSCGEGFQKHENWNWPSNILGDYPNDSFFIECFNYKMVVIPQEFSRGCWLSNGMLLYKVPKK